MDPRQSEHEYLEQAIVKYFLTAEQIARFEGVSKARIYDMIKQYEVRTIPFGRMIRLVPLWEWQKVPTAEVRRQFKGGQPTHKKNRKKPEQP